MAWFGPAVDVNATYKHAQQWGTTGHALGGYPHGRTHMATKLDMALQWAASDKKHTAQRDAEGMVEQAVVPRTSSHGESIGAKPSEAASGV